MPLKKGDRIALRTALSGIIALIGVIALIWATKGLLVPKPPEPPSPYDQHHGYDEEAEQRIDDVTSQKLMAVFAFFMFVVAGYQFVLLKQANETASEAIILARGSLEETKASNQIAFAALGIAQDAMEDARASNEAYIEAERGRMELRDLLINRSDQPAVDSPLGYMFENIGSFPATVTSRVFFTSIQDRDALPLFPFPTDLFFADQVVVGSGETLGVGATHAQPPLWLRNELINSEWDRIANGERVLFVQGSIQYVTMGRPYSNIFCWMYVAVLNTFTPIINRGFNYHGPDTSEDPGPLPVDPDAPPPRPVHGLMDAQSQFPGATE